ncbi:MAG: hypothetical protein GY772_00580 [bacterium]|nr:hypothetical protein [bacterium]
MPRGLGQRGHRCWQGLGRRGLVLRRRLFQLARPLWRRPHHRRRAGFHVATRKLPALTGPSVEAWGRLDAEALETLAERVK